MLYMFYYVHSISVVKIEDCKIYVMFVWIASIVSVTSSILYTLKVDLSYSKCQSNVISASALIYRNY